MGSDTHPGSKEHGSLAWVGKMLVLFSLAVRKGEGEEEIEKKSQF